MNRQLIVAGLVAFGLLLFVVIVTVMASPVEALQQQNESEPNNSFAEADTVIVPGAINGAVDNYDIGDTDYFNFTTDPGAKYQARLTISSDDKDMQAEMYLYDGAEEYLDSDGPSSSSASLSWTAYTSNHYIQVAPVVFTTTNTVVLTAEYRLQILKVAPTPTPTPSNTPTNTPQPSNTPFPTAISTADPYETYYGTPNNDTASRAYVMPVATAIELSTHLGVATFNTLTDVDWYAFWGKDDKWYRVETSNLSGVDTFLAVYKENGTSRITSNDDGGGGLASKVSFKASYTGYFYVRVTNKVESIGSYDMLMEETDEPPAEATNTPGPGPNSAADACEDNLDFEHACIIAANQPETFNFVPPYGGVDNDFFKLWIKPGTDYECFTSDLDPGVDPNMIVFTGPSWDDAVGGNDDREPGDLNSYFSYYATYTGWLYVLVGYGDRTPSDIYNSSYTLECQAEVPGEPTATPRPAATSGPAATSTPRSTSAPPTNTPFVGLSIRPLTTPTPKPETPSQPELVPINLLIYYDANGDGQPGAGEGVAGIGAQAYEVATNSLLAQGVTDEQGYLEFTVQAQGPVRVTVPFFGYSRLVTEETTIRLRVLSPALP
jgi:hypothetical protein